MEAKQMQHKHLNGFDMYKTGVEWTLRHCTRSLFAWKAYSSWFDAEKDSQVCEVSLFTRLVNALLQELGIYRTILS